MRCEDCQTAWLQARQEQAATPSPELEQHLAQCERCRSFCAAQPALEHVLAGLHDEVSVRPGFDTRFFARLEALKRTETRARTRKRWLWAFMPLTAAAAALVLVVHERREDARVQEDAAVTAELELVEDLPVVEKLDEVEAYEVLANVDLETLDAVKPDSAPMRVPDEKTGAP